MISVEIIERYLSRKSGCSLEPGTVFGVELDLSCTCISICPLQFPEVFPVHSHFCSEVSTVFLESSFQNRILKIPCPETFGRSRIFLTIFCLVKVFLCSVFFFLYFLKSFTFIVSCPHFFYPDARIFSAFFPFQILFDPDAKSDQSLIQTN